MIGQRKRMLCVVEKEFIYDVVIPFLEKHGHNRVMFNRGRFKDYNNSFSCGFLSRSNSNNNSWVGKSYCGEFVQGIDILSVKDNIIYISEVKSCLDLTHLQIAIGQIIMHKYALISYNHTIDIKYQIIFPKSIYKMNTKKAYRLRCGLIGSNMLSDDFIRFLSGAYNIEILVI